VEGQMNTISSTLLACLILLCDPIAQQLDLSPWLAVVTSVRDSAASVLSLWVIWRQWRAL
jgi:hypothetical protein